MDTASGGLLHFLADKFPGIAAAIISAWVAVRAYFWREDARRESVEKRIVNLETSMEARLTHRDYMTLIEKIGSLDGRLQKAEYGLTHVATDLARIVASVSRIETMLMNRRLSSAGDNE